MAQGDSLWVYCGECLLGFPILNFFSCHETLLILSLPSTADFKTLIFFLSA